MTSPALGLYLALARLPGGAGPGADADDPGPPRPEGPLPWFHGDDPARLPALAALADRLAEAEGHGVEAVLLTLPPGTPLPPAPPGRLILRHAPSEGRGAVRAFLDRWRPDLLLWVGGGLRPALIAAAPCPRLLIEGAPHARLLARGGWMPGLARAVAPRFDEALTGGAEARLRLRRAGVPEARLGVAPPLDAPTSVLPCNERERRDLAATLGARPVWLAADLPLAELAQVVAAQVRALRSAHRLLMIVAPRVPEDAGEMARALAAAGLRVGARADGAEPEEDVQAYLAEGTGELGLWYRLAPLTYVGGTLAGGEGGRSPFEAAALGSALLHGPRVAPHEWAWRRLAGAGAARLVRDGAEMGAAVESLLAPDRLAAMAHGAWDVATEGAEVAARVAAMVLERLPPAAPPP